MAAPVGQWRFNSPEGLQRAVDILCRTKGVLSIQIFPGRVVYTHQPWARVDLVGSQEEPSSWREKLEQMDLRHYNVGSLMEGVIFGWEHLRQMNRHATHVVAWNRVEFLQELFPTASWIHDSAFFDTLYGMQVVDLGQEGTADGEFKSGTVLVCGGRLLNGDVDDVDTGLLINRGKV